LIDFHSNKKYNFVLASSSFSFDGQTIAYYDATFIPLHNQQDELRLRFKTNYPNGVLFYAKGTQNNDFLTVELRNSSIFVGIDLGSTPERPGATLIKAGSVLDDYQWHDLAIIRYLKNISIILDQSVVREESRSAFNGLDLDGKVKKNEMNFNWFISLFLLALCWWRTKSYGTWNICSTEFSRLFRKCFICQSINECYSGYLTKFTTTKSILWS
jgi:hypothetical protein